GVGTMRSYFESLEKLLQKMKLTGEKYEDSKVLLKLKRDLNDGQYDPVVMSFTFTTKMADVKSKLIEYDEVLASCMKDAKKADDNELQELRAQLVASKEQTMKKEMEELRAQIEALKVELGKKESQSHRFVGKCFNCGFPGHRIATCRRHVNKADCKCMNC